MVTYAGPLATGDFGAESPSAFTLDHCFGLLDAATYEVDVRARRSGAISPRRARCGAATWRMVAHLVGTPYFPRIDGGILFLEDVGEHPYRVERMLYQLHHAGVLARQRAILLGRSPSTS